MKMTPFANMPKKAAEIRLGRDGKFDAWLYSMLIDNNLAFQMNPDIIASHEQLAFMVQLAEDQVYLPCSDTIFSLLSVDGDKKRLQTMYYNRSWRIICRIIRSICNDPEERKRVLQFCRYRYLQYTALGTLIPSRLVKRMTDLVLAQSFSNGDPWRGMRHAAFLRHREMLDLPSIRDNLEAMPEEDAPGTVSGMRRMLNRTEIARLFCLNTMARRWSECAPGSHEVHKAFASADQELKKIEAFFVQNAMKQGTILYLCDADGGVLFDIMTIRALMRMGHRVIFAVKDSFFFYSPTIDDVHNDRELEKLLCNAKILDDRNMSKNALLKELHDNRFVIINDGTRERINLYRVSVTFSRAWKESDIVLCKGWRATETFLQTSHEFTRDIVCFWSDDNGFHVTLRKHAATASKITEEEIRNHADAIIQTMREAHAKGLSVMFYSCIIGSIPGQTETAIKVAKTFVGHLRDKLDNVLIINPAEHFVEGMDGDDLMYMWERVQRSGHINVWRFQTDKDIEQTFALLNQKVPPSWSGKDATFSTGCTKEMRIALDVQSKNREMQIIGPDPRLFFRRGEYGVGKYFDATISRPAD